MKLFKSRKQDIGDKFDAINSDVLKIKGVLKNKNKIIHAQEILAEKYEALGKHKDKIIAVQKEEMAAKDRIILGLNTDLAQKNIELRALETLYQSRKKQLAGYKEETEALLEYKAKYFSLIKSL